MTYIKGVNGRLEVEASTKGFRPGEIYFALIIAQNATKGTDGALYMTVETAKVVQSVLAEAIEIAERHTLEPKKPEVPPIGADW